jgi:hypothetical protein
MDWIKLRDVWESESRAQVILYTKTLEINLRNVWERESRAQVILYIKTLGIN